MASNSKKNDDAATGPWFSRPSDIPIYYSLDHPVASRRRVVEEKEVGMLQQQIGQVRRVMVDPLSEFRETAVTFWATGKAHTVQSLSTLRAEENGVLRGSFVGVASLCGYAFGAFRGGRLKRLFYSSLFALGSAALSWPKEAEEIGNEALIEGQKAAQISFNFIKGAIPSKSSPSGNIGSAVTSIETKVRSSQESTQVKLDLNNENDAGK